MSISSKQEVFHSERQKIKSETIRSAGAAH